MSGQWKHVLPPGWLLGCLIAVYAGIEAFGFVLKLMDGAPDIPVVRVQAMVVVLTCGVYGAYRVIAFHPAWRPGYCRWLQSTPWAHPARLPLGPVHLIWQDAIFLLVAVGLLLRDPERPWAMAPLAFIVSYLVALVPAMMMTGQTRIGWTLLFVPGLALRIEELHHVLIACLPFYVLGYIGIQRSLRAFPWDIEKYWRSGQAGLQNANDMSKPRLGWPYARLQPFELKALISPETGIALSLLTVWYLSTFGRHPNDPEFEQMCLRLCSVFSVGAGIGRLGAYVAGHHPPISLLGRLFTGRFIIPGYDRVLLAPVASLLTGLLLPRVLDAAGLPWDMAYPIGAGAALALALNLPPTLATWRLTGSHRLAIGFETGQYNRI